MYEQGSPEFEHHVATFGPQSKFGYKDFIPQFKAEQFSAADWARLFKEAGREVRRAGGGAPRRLPDVRLQPHRVVGREDGAEARPRRRARARRAGRGPRLRRLLPPRRALVVLRRRHGVRLRREGPALRGLLRPGPLAEEGRGPERAAHEGVPGRLAGAHGRARRQVPARSSSGSTGGSSSRPSRRTCSASPPSTTTAARSGRRASPSTTRTRPSPRRRPSSTSSAASCPASGPSSGRPTPRSRRTRGATSRSRTTRRPDAIVDDLVDIVSKNGALLLNIGPRPDGTIPEPEQEILREIGRWLKTNGEAIYGTRPWVVYGEGPTEVVGGSFNDTKRQAFTGRDFRFTTKEGLLYAIALAPPDKSVTVKSLATGARHAKGRVRGVRLLGHDGALEWRQDESGLHISMLDRAARRARGRLRDLRGPVARAAAGALAPRAPRGRRRQCPLGGTPCSESRR